MSERVALSPERYRVVVTGRKDADMAFRTEAVAKAFMDHAVTLLEATRVRLYLDGELVEDRWAA